MRLRVAAQFLASLLADGCAGDSSEGGETTTAAASTEQTTTAATTREDARRGHAAPELEALLPGEIDGVALKKGSATGAGVFGSDAFSREMTKFLASVGKKPRDLRFANARDTSDRLGLETGVFRVPGIAAPRLRRAIVASSRPNAPDLRTGKTTLAGKPVTTLVYPGGAILYFYERGELVFYVGAQEEELAAKVVATFDAAA